MQNIILYAADEDRFEVETIERVFRAEPKFREPRYNDSGGALIEAQYVEPGDWTFVRLHESGDAISLSGTSDTTLRAALILQRHLNRPLRLVDTNYSFDLPLDSFRTLEELRAAIAKAQAQ